MLPTNDAAPVDTGGMALGTARRSQLDAAREELRASTREARAGIPWLDRYTSRVDDILRGIYRAADGITDTPCVLIPIGGYGRRQLCIHSDIDLLIVFGGEIGAKDEKFISAILHPLWDLGFEVGHQIRRFADFAQPETDNPEYLTALMEARFLVGNQALFDRVTNACLTKDSAWRPAMRAALVGLVKQRLSRFNFTVFHLEPDVKDSPGGLRDATAIRLLLRMDADALHDVYVDPGRLAEAEDFMLRVRSILHMERKRNANVLEHGLQEVVAKLFGSPGEQPGRQVERLMSTYYHHAQRINRSLQTLLKAADAPADAGRSVTPIDDDLAEGWDGIRFADGTRASLQPRTWLRPFEAALERDTTVSEQVLTCIERHGERYVPETFFPTDTERDQLLRLLRPRPGLYARLEDMHSRGLLGRMFPEFQKIYCHVTRDFYHKYTVDEHTLRAIRNVEHLCTPMTRSRKRFASLLAEVSEPELLVLALLFHDCGKWTNKNHSEEGVRMANEAMRRLRLPERSRQTIEFLIRHHLQMSVVAFRRDAEDPDTVIGFTRLVGSEERLKLLALLTLADVDAVSPGVLTPWKEEMLWRLYVESYNQLTLGYGDDSIDHDEVARIALNAQRPDDITEEELTSYLEGFPQRYLRLLDGPIVYDHLRLARDLKPGIVRPILTRHETSWELSAIALDQTRLFSNICGVLSFFGMDIMRGHVMSNQHGVALDIFEFEDREKFLTLNKSAHDELIGLLEDVVAGRVAIDEKLKGRWRAGRKGLPLKHIEPLVHYNNHYSKRFTVVEIVAPNGWGLLYRVSRAIADNGCSIDLVLINTEGVKALDVFHLTEQGGKLSEATQERLKADLEQTLGAAADH